MLNEFAHLISGAWSGTLAVADIRSQLNISFSAVSGMVMGQGREELRSTLCDQVHDLSFVGAFDGPTLKLSELRSDAETFEIELDLLDGGNSLTGRCRHTAISDDWYAVSLYRTKGGGHNVADQPAPDLLIQSHLIEPALV